MTKTEYLKQLDYKLRVLPTSERQDALDYYEGYISDAEDETAAIAQLGSPGEVAANILANYVSKTPAHEPGTYREARKEGTRGMRAAWMIILALFALPIGLPIIITLAIIPFTLFVVLLSFVFSFAVSALALVVSGIAGIITFPVVMMQDFGTGLITGGIGLVSLGLGILFTNLTILSMRGFPMIARFVANKIKRRSHHGR